MRLTAAAVTLLLLTGTAYAQPAINLWADDKRPDPEAEARQQEIDKAYRDKIKNIPANAAPAVNDPWGNVRASEKPAANKTQNSSKNR